MRSTDFNLKNEYARDFHSYYKSLDRNLNKLEERLAILQKHKRVLQQETKFSEIEEFLRSEKGFVIVLGNMAKDSSNEYVGHYFIVVRIEAGCISFIDPMKDDI